MRPESEVALGHGSLIDPAIEKYRLALNMAMDLEAFWKSAQELLAAAMPKQVVGLTLQHSPILPSHVRWTSPMPSGFFRTQPLKKFLDAQAGKKIVRLEDLFASRRNFARSTIYRRYLAPQQCAHNLSAVLATATIDLGNCHHAHIRTGRSLADGTEISTPALFAVLDHVPAPTLAGT